MRKLFGTKFLLLKVAQLLSAVYIVVLTFSKSPIGLVDPKTGDIIDVHSPQNTVNGVILINGSYRAIVAANRPQKIFLAISRISAFSMYPVLIAVFLTKCKALMSFLQTTPLSIFMIDDIHELHTYAGEVKSFYATEPSAKIPKHAPHILTY